MHGGIAAIVVGVCVAAVLAVITAGVAKVAKPISEVPPQAAGHARDRYLQPSSGGGDAACAP